MKSSVFALALIAMAGLSATTVLANDRDVEKATLSYADVDLNNPQAAATFYKRLERTAKAVCDSDLPFDAGAALQDRVCARQSLDEAVRQIGNERLSNLHASRSGDAGATVTASLDTRALSK